MHELIDITTLVNLLGNRFIEYACNVTPKQLSTRLGDKLTPLPKNKESALQVLLDSASRPYSPSATMDDNRASIISFLSDYEKRFTDTVTLNEIRVAAGGSLLAYTNADPIIQQLTTLARDAYPFYLIPASPAEPNQYYNIPPSQLSYYLSIKTYVHPDNKELVTHLNSDDTLKLLFPAQNAESEDSAAYMINGFNSGNGSVAQSSLFADGLIRQAFYECTVKGEFSCQDLVDATLRNLTKLKTLIEGKSVEVPLITGVSGLELAEGQRVTTPWGVIRHAHDIEKIWLKSPFQGQTPEVKVVFESTFNLTMSVAAKLEDIQHPKDQRQSDRETEEKLAIVSALPQIVLNRTLRIQQLASKVIPPFQSGDSMSWPFVNVIPFQQAMTDDEIKLIEAFALKVNSANYQRVIISFRRLASAVQRLDINDGFIDLIVIWENLFGTSGGEVSFRIALSISKLLHDNEADRQQTFDRVKDLYGKRSKIVHGSRHYTPQQVSLFWNESLDITVRVLTKLFTDQPELLTFTSDTRSKKIALC